MRITKLGHCCMLIEENGVRILTDPGMFSTAQDTVKNVHAVLITHEHYDHLHVESVKRIRANNPGVTIFTNKAVGKILDEHTIPHTLLIEGKMMCNGVVLEAFDGPHAPIHESVPPVENTSFSVGGRLFFPGDAFLNPRKPVDVLALPVAGPWLKASDAVAYGLAIKPKVAFPVHDGMLRPDRVGSAHFLPQRVLSAAGINFIVLEEGRAYDL
jgi:L-ascorbate metabolism protein UlaG (beta-lactamase superfamily)